MINWGDGSVSKEQCRHGDLSYFPCTHVKKPGPSLWWSTLLILALRKQMQASLCELEAYNPSTPIIPMLGMWKREDP